MSDTLQLVISVDDRGSPVVKQFTGNVTSAADAMEKRGGAAAKTMQQHVSAFGGGLTQTTKQILGMTSALLGIGGGVAAVTKLVGSMSSFQSTMANVSTLVDTSKVSVEGLRQEVLALPPALGSATELAEGLYEALSAGVEPAKAVAFVGDAAKLAKAGLTETKTAVDVLTTALNAYGLQADQTGRISDVLFKTVEIGKTTMEDLASQIGVAIPLAAQLNIPIEDLGASVATLTAGGLKTATAVDAMKSAFSQMISNAEKFRAVGIDVGKVISEEGLAGLLRRLQQATGGNAEALQKLIPDVQGFTAVVALAGKQADKFTAAQTAMREAAGATETAYQKQQATFKAAMERLSNTFDRVVQEHGPAVLATLTQVTDFLTASLGPAVEFIAKAWDVVNGAFNLMMAMTLTGIKLILDGVTGLLSAASKAAEFLGFPGVAAGLKSASDAVGGLSTTVGGLKDAAIDTAVEWTQRLQSVQTETAKTTTATTEAGNAATQAGDAQKKAAEEAAAKVRELQDAYKALGLTTGEDLRKAADKSLAAFQLIASEGRQSAATLLDTWLDVTDKQEAAFGKLSAAGQRYTRELANAALQEFLRIKNSGTETPAQIAARWETLEDQFAALGLQLPAYLQPAFASIQAAGTGAADTIGNAFAAASQAIAAGFADVAEQARVQFSRAESAATQTFERLQKAKLGRIGETDPLHPLNDPDFYLPGTETPFARTEAGLEQQLQQYAAMRKGVLTSGAYNGMPEVRAAQLKEIDAILAALAARLNELSDAGDKASQSTRAMTQATQASAQATQQAASTARSHGVDPFPHPRGALVATPGGGNGYSVTPNTPSVPWTTRHPRIPTRWGSYTPIGGGPTIGNNPYGFDFETRAAGAYTTRQGQRLTAGSGEMLLSRSVADGLRALVREGGGRGGVTINNPRFDLQIQGVDARSIDGKKIMRSLLPALREELRRAAYDLKSL